MCRHGEERGGEKMGPKLQRPLIAAPLSPPPSPPRQRFNRNLRAKRIFPPPSSFLRRRSVRGEEDLPRGSALFLRLTLDFLHPLLEKEEGPSTGQTENGGGGGRNLQKCLFSQACPGSLPPPVLCCLFSWDALYSDFRRKKSTGDSPVRKEPTFSDLI